MSRRIFSVGLLLCVALGGLNPPLDLPRIALQGVSRPRMDEDFIPYGERRKHQMAHYSLRLPGSWGSNLIG
jgi:hypothetical protein